MAPTTNYQIKKTYNLQGEEPMTRLPTVVAVLLIVTSTSAAELKVAPDKDNVVASRLEGRWKVNAGISTRLGRNRGGILEFNANHKVVAKIPQKYNEFLADRTIYMAGTMIRDETAHGFILIQHKGNPHVVYFRERDGDPFGDAESFNVMLAVAEDTANDLLFVGGDFNNQPFTAYERSPATQE